MDNVCDCECLPERPWVGSFSEACEKWWIGDSYLASWRGIRHYESYVNLIPTLQGGMHVNGLRTGLLEAMREFCKCINNLLPRNWKLVGEDVWEQCRYVLSIKIQEPQFLGQIKERLISCQSAYSLPEW